MAQSCMWTCSNALKVAAWVASVAPNSAWDGTSWKYPETLKQLPACNKQGMAVNNEPGNTQPKRVKRRHAGGIGTADLCESNVGERVPSNELCKYVARKVAVHVPNGFAQ